MSELVRMEFLAAALLIVTGTVLVLYFAVTGRRRATRQLAADRPAETDSEFASEHPPVAFADVAGLDDAIAELDEMRDYLADPSRFQTVGADLPRGILLCGPPGNGKTLLARALAGETGVPFYYVSAASFVEQYVGLGAARIRRLFNEAKRKAPAIVFIDELDAVGRRRSSGTAGDREYDHTLNQLLVELDGFVGATGVLMVGATNRPELLDPALVRPGRFDRRVQIDRPDITGREAILRLYAQRRPFSRHVDWGEVASQTAGLSAAELASLVNEAALLAARRHRTKIAMEDVEEAITRISRGTRSSRLLDEEEKRLIAVHEAGHVLLTLVLRGVKPPSRLSLVTRTATTGSPWSHGEDREISTKRELMAQLIVLLGGRAAEVLVFGDPTTRAEDDLDDAAKLARRMVERWAMTGKLELAGRDPAHGPAPNGMPSDLAVRKLLRNAQQAAHTILEDHVQRLHAVADALMERETLTLSEVAELTNLWSWRSEEPEREMPRVARLHA
ncbi:MAG: AAA family ATPase [Actinomycetota bacterium]|nr:AAA family ATPase [Actinomycetota bacterium]